MKFHGSCTLKGPVTQDLPWWTPRQKQRRPSPAKGVRTALVARVKAQIAAGTYDTPDRWDAALARLAAALGTP
jgi:Anti-sigma-28 factor, FlgM